MWRRFSGEAETYIDRDMVALEDTDTPPDTLLEQLRLRHGTLRVEPDHFRGRSRGDRFYPILYMLTRMRQRSRLGYGYSGLLGKMSRLELHHIFPKLGFTRRATSGLKSTLW